MSKREPAITIKISSSGELERRDNRLLPSAEQRKAMRQALHDRERERQEQEKFIQEETAKLRKARKADENGRIVKAKTPPRTQAPYRPSGDRSALRQLTEEQLESFIHAGPVPSEIRWHEEIVTEVIEKAADGWPMQVRQMVSTPVRKLLEQEAIDLAGIYGASMLRWDHDQALYSRMTGKWEMAVDGGGKDTSDLEKRVHHADRMHKAFKHLGYELGRIAWTSIIERPLGDLTATYVSAGQSLLPRSSKPEQTGAGKASLVLTVRELARFYKATNAPDLPHIQEAAILDYLLRQKNLKNLKKTA